jgi:hypothetical protein
VSLAQALGRILGFADDLKVRLVLQQSPQALSQ